MALGDVAFYKSKGSLIDQMIELRTGSKIVHVAFCVNDAETIAATSAGVTRQPLGSAWHVWTPNVLYDQDRLLAANDFLSTQLGQPYGYADLVNQVLLLTGKDPILLDKSSDCSVLVTRALWVAGYPLPAAYITPEIVTPGALYATLTGLKE